MASPDGRYVYVGGGNDGVAVIDTDTNSVVGSVSGVGDSRGLTVSPDGSRLYGTQINFDRVAIVNTETLAVVDSVPLERAWNVVAAPDGTRAYAVAFTADPNVSVIALQAPPVVV